MFFSVFNVKIEVVFLSLLMKSQTEIFSSNQLKIKQIYENLTTLEIITKVTVNFLNNIKNAFECLRLG